MGLGAVESEFDRHDTQETIDFAQGELEEFEGSIQEIIDFCEITLDNIKSYSIEKDALQKELDDFDIAVKKLKEDLKFHNL